MDRIQEVPAQPGAGATGMARAAQMLSRPGALMGADSAQQAAAAQGPSFANLLTSAIQSVQQTQAEATSVQQAYQQGAPNVGLEETMVAMNKASLSFQMLAQARNRVVAAYNDVINMPV